MLTTRNAGGLPVDSRVAIAIDIGGTKAEAAIVTYQGAVVPGSRVRAGTGPDMTVAALVSILRDIVRASLSAMRPNMRLVGAGIGSAGPLDRHTRSVSPVNMPAAAGVPVAEVVEAALAEGSYVVPAVLALDGIALAMAEHWLTPGRPAQSLLGIVVSTGVGGGLIVDGLPLTGSTANAGQIGQSYASGFNPGITLEEVACGPASVRYAQSEGWRGSTGEDLARSAAVGDPIALDAVERSARTLGDSVASFAAVVDFERVVIAGGFSRVAPDYIERVAARLKLHPFTHVRAIPVEAARRPADSPLVGAAALAFQRAGG